MKTFPLTLCFCLILQNFLHSIHGQLCNVENSLKDFGSESEESIITLAGMTNLSPTTNQGEVQLQSNVNISKITTTNCPSLEEAENLSQTELLARLTAPCRYDRLERPSTSINEPNPVNIFARAYIYQIQSVAQTNSHFSLQALVEFRYIDSRLAFASYLPPERRTQNKPIKGGPELRDLIWIPHVFASSEQDSSVLGILEKDIITSINADGTVAIASRVQATLVCSVHLKNFPFDEQYCSTTFESWLYNDSDLILHWEDVSPITLSAEIDLPEYDLKSMWYNETIVDATTGNAIWKGAFLGNYSSLSFTVHLTHDAGYYVIDYFIPSMILVAASWVSFWISADQTPTRTILCCHTMLSMITLASSQFQNSSSFDTVFEIWFLGCVIFIFGSLVEFAFSNTILRRKRDVQVKKMNSKSILKSTVLPRKENRRKSIFDTTPQIDTISALTDSSVIMTNCSTLTSAPSSNCLTMIIDNHNNNNNRSRDNVDSIPKEKLKTKPARTFATMTPKEVSQWLDKKSRFVFPFAFLIFNIFFWVFVLIL